MILLRIFILNIQVLGSLQNNTSFMDIPKKAF
jgi:hypothetical protein